MRCELCLACNGLCYVKPEPSAPWWALRTCYTCFGRGMVERNCLGVIQLGTLPAEQPREGGGS
jgi:hypothetical protein